MVSYVWAKVFSKIVNDIQMMMYDFDVVGPLK
jgi:hypothetical protein